MTQQPAFVPIRDAATVIVLRHDTGSEPEVLMGQRGAKAAFMPNKFVFPGGAVDPEDHDIPLASSLTEGCMRRLIDGSPDATRAHALAVAAIRELWEETGLALGRVGDWPHLIPDDWRRFAEAGLRPDASALRFVFRAITPPGRPRRFDARFFMLDATAATGDLDDFSNASDELSHLQWIPLSRIRSFDLPFITEVVLAEVAANLRRGTLPESIPFFQNDDEHSLFLRLDGRPVSDMMQSSD